MATPQLLQESWTRMIQDAPRDELPSDAAWYMQDLLPNLGLTQAASQGGRLAKRGGFRYASEDISVLPSATKATAAGYLATSGRFCFTTDNNYFAYQAIPAEVASINSVSSASIQSAQDYVDIAGTLILTNNDGTTALKSYDGTTFGALGGSPPTAKYAAVWKNRLLLGATSANPRRTFFSALGNPASWDTTNSWVDINRNITGYAVLPNCILVFGDEATARIRGSIPPPGSPDMGVDDPIFNTGCTFTRSIAVNGSFCVFANEEGVFLTNGTSTLQDMTLICGIKAWWNRHTANLYVPGIGAPAYTASVSGGFIKQFYLAFIRSAYNNAQYAVAFNLDEQSAYVFKFTDAIFYNTPIVQTPQIGDDLYVATQDGSTRRIVSCSGMWTPTSTNKADANGTAITPILETRYYLDQKTYKQRWRYAYLDYRLDDAASDDPTLAVSYITEPASTSYTSLGTLNETTSSANVRAKLPIRTASRGIAFKVAQSGNSLSTVINSLSVDVRAREGNR